MTGSLANLSDPSRRDRRVFLFLQGPHGPFFNALGRMLQATGAEVWRVGFNAGDALFWRDRAHYIAFRRPLAEWPARLSGLLDEKGVTDIVLYGDTRPIHAQATAIARARGLCLHVFEEGYLRPFWVTYERGGSNGHSRLMRLSLDDMRAALPKTDRELKPAPDRWGDMRQHVFYGATYHFAVLAGARAYPGFRSHRAISIAQEFRLYLRRLLLMPWHAIERRLATARVMAGGFPYHLALLQLEHDASFRAHGPFATLGEFAETCIRGFAEGAPVHHHLVFKAHPLEDGRSPIARDIRRLAARHGLKGRVHFLRGGKLARLLDQAKSAVTVNSTAGQQVLWRGLPLRAFGQAVYAKPEFVSTQPLAEFFSTPAKPDRDAYNAYRRFLLQTSQVSGGFYSATGRRRLLRRVVDMIVDPREPYETRPEADAAPAQQSRPLSAEGS
ncbi:MAG: capsular biosynthesis protein [Paracoccaceae bacterium]